MVEYVVWVIDCMENHYKEGTFASYENAYDFGCLIEEDMSIEEDWYIECRVDGQFDHYIGF